MDETTKQAGVTRRGFIRTMGIGGIAATALNISGPAGAQAPTAGQTAAMPKRKLGKTGAEVSILCLGGMFDTINNQLLLRQAFNWGVTYWDTAEGYGYGLSEEGFGRFFTRYPETRKNIFLVTKFRPSPPDKLSEALDKGLKRLCTDYVDVFFTHGISEFNCQAAVGGKVPVNDVMRCLMYYREYNDRELARDVFAGLPEEARSQLTRLDFSQAEKACPQGLAIAKLMAEASQLLA